MRGRDGSPNRAEVPVTKTRIALLLLTSLSLLVLATAALAAEEKLSMRIGDTHIISVDRATTVVPGNEKVVKVISKGNQVVLKAIAAGYSSVTVGETTYKVTVYSDEGLEEIRDLIEDMLLDIEGISVNIVGGRVLISGEVLANDDMNRITGIAEAYDVVVNLARLDPKAVDIKPMFRLAFDFVEVDRDKAKEYGMNLSGNLATMVFNWMDVVRNGPTVQLDDMIHFDATQAFTRVWESHEATVLNGESTHYEYGGVLLIPVQTQTTVNLIERPFGIILEATPRIDRRDNVHLEVNYEISDVTSFEAGVYTLSNKVQETTVLLKEGQSLALAGVVRHKSQREYAGMPWLADVPLLGAFFSTRAFSKEDTDGVVFITPYLIEPDGDENRDLIDRNIEEYRDMKMWP